MVNPQLSIPEPKREMTYIRSDRACDKLTLWYWAEDPVSQEKYQALVPLTDVAIKGTINGCLANLNVQMTYINGDDKSPIEGAFEFPIKNDGKFAVNYVSVKIGDKMIEFGQNEQAK